MHLEVLKLDVYQYIIWLCATLRTSWRRFLIPLTKLSKILFFFLLELTISRKERVQVLRQPTQTCLKFLATAINNTHSSSRNLGGTHGKCRSQVIDLVLPPATGAGQVWGHLVQRRQAWPRVSIINQINCYDFSLNRVVINQCRSIYGHSLELLLVWLGPPLNEELTTHLYTLCGPQRD